MNTLDLSTETAGLRRPHATVMLLCGLLLATSCAPSAEEPIPEPGSVSKTLISGFNKVPLDSSYVAASFRAQVVDILPLDRKRFVVTWFEEENSWLYFRRFDAESGYKGPTYAAARSIGTGDVRWVRGMSGGPVVNPATNEFMNLAVFEVGDSIYASRHSYRSGNWQSRLRSVSHHNAGTSRNGGRPSVAWGYTGTSPSAGKALVVWGKDGDLMGRFHGFNGYGIGSPFKILTTPLTTHPFIFSTDIIWNSKSQRFIVGYVARDNAQHCQYWNVRLRYDGSIDHSSLHPTPTQRGLCGHNVSSGGDGHHTSVAYDRRSWNTDGVYAWWYIDSVGSAVGNKGIRIMDRWGDPLLDGAGNKIEILLPEAITVPVAPNRSTGSSLFDPHRYVFASTPAGSGAFSAYGAYGTSPTYKKRELVYNYGSPKAWPRAVATLTGGEAVVVWTECSTGYTCARLSPTFLSVTNSYNQFNLPAYPKKTLSNKL